MKKHNFFAGPAILPQCVKEKASQSLIDFDGMGLSVMEISHRSPQWQVAMDKALSLPKELLGIGDTHEVLYLTGGASTQFLVSAMNLLPQDGKAGYVDTGTWSAKAIKEAKAIGNIEVIASSKEDNYTYIPKDYPIDENLNYLHITSNNTVFGTQYRALPKTNVPIVADMSSDIFSYPIDIDRYDLIYCGAQKNMGPAGTTLVIVRKEVLGKTGRQIPTILDYQTHIGKGSMFNTPPVLPIYISMLTMQWVKDNGGVKAMQERNQAKASLLYNEIDRNSLFEGLVRTEDRSEMNACFKLLNEGLQGEFLQEATNNGVLGIKGHRSVGGFRASMYNAMDIASVEVLVDIMKELENKHG